MLFSRGTWAIFGADPDSQETFIKALSDPDTLFGVSQLAASVTTKFRAENTHGIVPFETPRLDEQLTDVAKIAEINELTLRMEDPEYNPSEGLPVIQANEKYLGSLEDFCLGNHKYGFWFVENEYEDVSDLPSKREHLSYQDMNRPYKFLIKDEKSSIESKVAASSVLGRSQFPVLIDFQHGRVYAASSNKDSLTALQETLVGLGVKYTPLVWDFEYPSWPGEFLSRIAENTCFKNEMKARAEELSRHSSAEVEKLEDRAMEKIVSNFFAISELESEVWVALSTPAKVRIHKPIDPVGVSNPSVAFELLDTYESARPSAAASVFQEVVIKRTKGGGEKLYRNDLFTVDINDNANIQDVGAAMLRGFDLPRFKKEVKATLKTKGTISIKDFWSMWLQGIHDSILIFTDSVTSVLDIDKKKYGLIQPDLGDSEDLHLEGEN